MPDTQEQGPWTKYQPPPQSSDSDSGPWSKYASPDAAKPTMAPGSFQQRKGGPVLNANTTGIQGQSPKQVSENLKADAAGGSRVGAPTALGRVASEGALGAASGFSGMPESSTPLSDFGAGLKNQQDEFMEHPVKTIAKQALLGPAPQLYEMGKGLLESGGEIGSGIVHFDPEKVAHGGGRLVGQAAQLGLLKEAPEAVGKSGTVGKIASEVARDPATGDLKPGAVTAGKVGGGVIGGGIGAVGGESLMGNHGGGIYGGVQGARAGVALGPTVLDKMIPPRAVYPGAPLPTYEDFAENHAEDLTKRGKAQEKIDSGNAAKLKEAEDTRQKGLADRGKLEMQDATEQAAAVRRAQRAEEVEKARTATLGGPQNAPVRPGGKIVGPEASPLDAPTTYQSYQREKLVDMARKGDRNAYNELVRNPKDTDLNQFKYQYGYGVTNNPVYQPQPFRKYDAQGNLAPNTSLASARRPLLLGKPPVTAEAPVKPMTASVTEPAAPASPVAPMKPPEATQSPAPMRRASDTGPEPRRPLAGETPERRKATRDIVRDMSVEQLERDANQPGVHPDDKARMLRNAADLREMRNESPVKPMQKPSQLNLEQLTPAQRQKAASSGVHNGQKLTPQELAGLRSKK